ncbi:MAG TPA: CoA-acylating methylmalonate-semialdehyde dehydrogenase [Pirellulales bacterium]|jgi:malonate-semialdehyde dehydrogenase (acetylating)/methylmalonate-semialdehyde dehydrogenase
MSSAVSDDSAASLEVPILIGGQLEKSTSNRRGNVFNPSTGRVQGVVPFCTAEEIDRAVRAAHEALPSWSDTPVVERARVMFRFREQLQAHSEELAALVTREHGKTISEARAELQRGIEMVEFACGIPSLLMGQSLENLAPSVDCQTSRHPLGVCVGITPFNFPSMVPLWMFPVALMCGNAFVLKPSEKVPLSAMKLGELLVAAGLPAGVFNIVHGDKTAVDALLTHPLVRAVSFVGSTNIAKYVYTTGTAHGKRVQAAGGAKNHLIIMPDADLGQTVKALQTSAFGCAGERCMAGSIAVPVGRIADDVVEELCRVGKQMKVGPTDHGADVDMGPLVTSDHRDRVATFLDVARGEGAEVALDGRSFDLPHEGFLLGPSVVDHVQPTMRLAREEIFGPVLSVVRASNLDEALAVGRDCEYGNGASIFTQSGWAAREFQRHFNAGMIGVNVGVPAPMAWFPFSGWNKSFFGDLHMQGVEGVMFYTQQKLTMTRWFRSASDSPADPIWKASAGGAK